MLKTVICAINARLEGEAIVDQLYDLAELHHIEGGDFYAAIYQGKGDWVHVLDIDSHQSVIYHRGIAPFTEEVADDEQQKIGCDDQIVRSYPMKLVAFTRKNALGDKNDDNYFEHRLSNLLRETIRIENDTTIGDTFGLTKVSVIPTAFAVIQQDITPGETSKPFPVPLEYAIVSIDYTIMLMGTASCFDACANEFE